MLPARIGALDLVNDEALVNDAQHSTKVDYILSSWKQALVLFGTELSKTVKSH